MRHIHPKPVGVVVLAVFNVKLDAEFMGVPLLECNIGGQ
jgi:hypothetical protein